MIELHAHRCSVLSSNNLSALKSLPAALYGRLGQYGDAMGMFERSLTIEESLWVRRAERPL